MKKSHILIARAIAAALSCSKDQTQELTPYDYSIDSNWMVKTDIPTQDVDLFYIYPTCAMSCNTPSSDLNESEKATALNAYIGSAYCMNKFHIHTPGLADAQINSSRVSLTCTTITGYLTFEVEPFGDKSLYGYDSSAYIENIKESVQTRIAAYKKATLQINS